MTVGCIPGDPTSLPRPKSIKFKLDIQIFTPPSNGYGRADVSLNIKSSFGFYSMADLAPETF